jgi:hypothetical protein
MTGKLTFRFIHVGGGAETQTKVVLPSILAFSDPLTVHNLVK